VSAAEYRAEWPEDPHDWFRKRVGQRKSQSPLVFAWAPSRNSLAGCSPAYVVAVAEDGTVEFWGDANTRAKGYHAWTMPLARLEKLKARVREPDIAEPGFERVHSWYAVMDATPPCVFVASWREPWLCTSGGHRKPLLRMFLPMLDFESNAVQRIGEREQDCDVVDLLVVDPEPNAP